MTRIFIQDKATFKTTARTYDDAGFLHVPFSATQAARKPSPVPSMSTEDIARGIVAAIGAIADPLPR